jgi:gamma-D-glutamyl-L-lysine dipeptidyl-peptidase
MRPIRTAALHREPDAGSEQVTELLAGEPVVVVATHGDWTLVHAVEQPSATGAAGYPGWVRSDALSADPLEVARTYLATPYVWGGLSRSGIDCSGLVHAAYRTVGIRVPRDAADQAAAAEPVVDPGPGDLLFFARLGQPVHHVGFVSERGILHASSEAGGVVDEPLSDARRASLIGAGRLP